MEASPCETKLPTEDAAGVKKTARRKKMFYRNTNDNKHLNIRIVSLAAGLALATAAVLGGSSLVKEDNTSSNSTAPVTQRVERTTTQFGTSADAVYASQSITAPWQFGSMADADYASIGFAYLQSASIPDAAVVGRDEALGLGQPSSGQSFATDADAVYAAESLRPQTDSAPVDKGDYLGINQPAVGQSFATAADAVYAAESMLGRQAVTPSVTSENLGNYLGLGQPDEMSSSEPQFGTMADADFASR
jgi:hypothetical protein